VKLERIGNPFNGHQLRDRAWTQSWLMARWLMANGMAEWQPSAISH
jgi:hypothetical protein